jgi:NAD(P)-dependent dehydrogenase (short-subunit alcohol dehydrogenase family)
MSVRTAFDLTGRVIVITGAAGLLGRRHASAVAEMGAIPILVDIDARAGEALAADVRSRFGGDAMAMNVDITDLAALEQARDRILARYGWIDGLVNNAANNPKVEGDGDGWTRLENFPLELWDKDLAIGLTGAFLCARVFGTAMAARGSGAIVNIASDLAMIGPDQRIYRKDGVADEAQPVKPVSYSVVKSGLLGLTRYLATYWADRNVRVNALSPGGVYAQQEDAFVARLSNLIPLGRMARQDEYEAAIVFLLSDASSYMTGANVSMDGGRTAW